MKKKSIFDLADIESPFGNWLEEREAELEQERELRRKKEDEAYLRKQMGMEDVKSLKAKQNEQEPTTIVYSNKGEYLDTIAGDKPMELHYLTDKQSRHAKRWLKRGGSLQFLGEESVRNSSEFYVGANTVNALRSYFEFTKANKHEYGGMLYTDGISRELKLEACTGCILKGASITGMQNRHNYEYAESRVYLGSWHTHPVDNDETLPYDNARPSGLRMQTDGDLWVFKDIKPTGYSFSDPHSMYKLPGGFGLIGTKHGMTMYRHLGTQLEKRGTDFIRGKIIGIQDTMYYINGQKYFYRIYNWRLTEWKDMR